ncbi:substrate-binding domain-containing protein [Wenjunlia tyrosinilytica]|jgi:simple sugar transport system substrate-binding protein|uniref:Sugar ABC transporter substrate-binding protein n=1 Tax=Wenjunlia tyrosinilytica TaxID=1544741 RepID=A0A918DZK9_9ACTN|nr:substrate-binding domain-containing protein [Wenjunlia tyrosinilytica]GGO90398.1 sugar ABC transporter substrate-binding protein [Wenjunlia tyrosinilytica]
MNHRARACGSRRLLAAALVAAGALIVAGCSSGSGDDKADTAADKDTSPKASITRMRIAMITHAAPGDAFWDIIRKGAKAAAARDNVELIYSSDPDADKQADLVQEAIDDQVDGIAVTLADPDAMAAAVANAEQSGIPVVGFNAGLNDWKSQGLLEFFGQDERLAGQAFGKKLNGLGSKHNICVIHEQGNVALEDRCAGLKKTFKGRTENVYVNGTDMKSVQSAITGKLEQDPSIDYVVTLGAPFALTAVKSVSEAGGNAEIATFDLNKDLTEAVLDGTVQLAVDQQPYLQGYLPVDSLWLYKSNGNFSGGGVAPVLTGPAFITKDNVESTAKFAAKGTR